MIQKKDINIISGITPLNIDLAPICYKLVKKLEQLHVSVRFNVKSDFFPNSRNNIHYDFNKKTILVGGEISKYTSLALMFFLAHGLGHFIQRKNPLLIKIQDKIITKASNNTGLFTMYDKITISNKKFTFGEFFANHELDASAFGLKIIKKLSNEKDFHWVRFWYITYANIDHLYHRQSITGPWIKDVLFWKKVFARKFEEFFLQQRVVNLISKSHKKHIKKSLCAYIGEDGLLKKSTGLLNLSIFNMKEYIDYWFKKN